MKQVIRTIAWCMLFLGTVAGAAAAENTAATQTTLTVATNNAGPRTKATLTAHVSADTAGPPSGVVNFRSGDTDLGSAVLDGEGNASLATDLLPAGNHQVVAIYQGQPSYQASISRPEQVHADASTVAGFTVAVTPTSLSTTVGGFVSAVVTVTPVNGFNAYVSLSCNGLPVNTTCNFTPTNVLASCSAGTCTPATSSMQIQTQEPSPLVVEFLFPVLLGLAGLGACKRGAWRNVVLGMLAFAGALGITACAQRYRYLNHGPPDNPGTPAGTYTVTVEAQSSTGSATTTPPTQPQLTLTITVPKS
jgi:Bacterial Ig-like domain (group 3)